MSPEKHAVLPELLQQGCFGLGRNIQSFLKVHKVNVLQSARLLRYVLITLQHLPAMERALQVVTPDGIGVCTVGDVPHEHECLGLAMGGESEQPIDLGHQRVSMGLQVFLVFGQQSQ